MWIKTKDGRIHDVSQCTIEIVSAESGYALIQMIPRSGKPIGLLKEVDMLTGLRAMQYIEDGIANGRLMIQLE